MRGLNKLPQMIKHGLGYLVLFAVALIPFMSVVNVPKLVFGQDNRLATALPTFVERGVDTQAGVLKPFEQPIISITFDDGWESVYTTAAPLLQKYGVHSTQYLLSGETRNANYMSDAQIRKLHDAGHEIACHTVDHANLTTLSDAAIHKELADCKTYFSKNFGAIQDFASPFGQFDDRTLAAIRTQYRSHRDTNGDITNGVDENDINVKDHFDQYHIIGVTIRHDTTLAQLQEAIDYTIAHNGWLVLTYHQIDDDNSIFAQDSYQLDQQLAFLSHTQARIVPLGDVLTALGDK